MTCIVVGCPYKQPCPDHDRDGDRREHESTRSGRSYPPASTTNGERP